jgi:hypothetical protein
MGADKGGYEDLIFQGQPGKLRENEGSFDRNLLLGKSYTLDQHRTTLGDAEQVLPVGGFQLIQPSKYAPFVAKN